MIHRPGAVAERRGVADRAVDVRPGSIGTASGRAWPSARCAAMAAANVQPVPCVCRVGMARTARLVEMLAVKQHVDDVGRVEVAALDDHGPRSQVVQPARRLAGLGLGAHRPSGQHLRLRRVRRHDRSQGQQVAES